MLGLGQKWLNHLMRTSRQFSISSSVTPRVHTQFHEFTNTACYIVSCPNTKQCAIIDSVLDYDPVNHKLSYTHLAEVTDYVTKQGLHPAYLMETHVHADHLTASALLKKKYPAAKIVIGAQVTKVQEIFKKILNLTDLQTDGSQFDHLLQDEETFGIGDVKAKALSTPGHTPACMTYVIGDAVFTGDTIFMPDFGTARCDFPGGSAETLYDSVQKLYSLPGEYRVFVGHDYGPNGRAFQWESTVKAEREGNQHLNKTTTKDAFVKWRSGRDSTLSAPRLLMQSLQVNLRAGQLPPAESNGQIYFKIPVKTGA